MSKRKASVKMQGAAALATGSEYAKDIEAERQAEMGDMDRDDPDWRDSYRDGTMGCHEALHVASVALDFVEQNLIDHGAVLMDRRRYKLACDAHRALYRLYQAIGAKHLGGVKD